MFVFHFGVFCFCCVVLVACCFSLAFCFFLVLRWFLSPRGGACWLGCFVVFLRFMLGLCEKETLKIKIMFRFEFILSLCSETSNEVGSSYGRYVERL